jgi:hypothetical protein
MNATCTMRANNGSLFGALLKLVATLGKSKMATDAKVVRVRTITRMQENLTAVRQLMSRRGAIQTRLMNLTRPRPPVAVQPLDASNTLIHTTRPMLLLSLLLS